MAHNRQIFGGDRSKKADSRATYVFAMRVLTRELALLISDYPSKRQTNAHEHKRAMDL